MLVGTNDGGIDMMRFPIQLAVSVALRLDGGEDTVPDPHFLPPVEAGGHAGRRAVAGGQVRPRCAGAQDPQHAVDHRAVVVARAATLAALGRAAGREQGLQPRILCVR